MQVAPKDIKDWLDSVILVAGFIATLRVLTTGQKDLKDRFDKMDTTLTSTLVSQGKFGTWSEQHERIDNERSEKTAIDIDELRGTVTRQGVAIHKVELWQAANGHRQAQ